jgi:hypothetical protein
MTEMRLAKSFRWRPRSNPDSQLFGAIESASFLYLFSEGFYPFG